MWGQIFLCPAPFPNQTLTDVISSLSLCLSCLATRPHRYIAGVDEAVRGLHAVQLRGALVLDRHLQDGRARGVKGGKEGAEEDRKGESGARGRGRGRRARRAGHPQVPSKQGLVS